MYRGRASALFKAVHRASQTLVALKLYRKKKLSVLNRCQVEREARLQTQLSHPHIVQLYAAFEDEKHVYMVQVRCIAS